jgi:hypothetical protein
MITMSPINAGRMAVNSMAKSGDDGHGNADQHLAALLRHVEHRPAAAALADCAGALNPQPSTLNHFMNPNPEFKNGWWMQFKRPLAALAYSRLRVEDATAREL